MRITDVINGLKRDVGPQDMSILKLRSALRDLQEVLPVSPDVHVETVLLAEQDYLGLPRCSHETIQSWKISVCIKITSPSLPHHAFANIFGVARSHLLDPGFINAAGDKILIQLRGSFNQVDVYNRPKPSQEQLLADQLKGEPKFESLVGQLKEPWAGRDKVVEISKPPKKGGQPVAKLKDQVKK